MDKRIPVPPQMRTPQSAPSYSASEKGGSGPPNLLLDALLLGGGWALRYGVDWVKKNAIAAYTTELTVTSDDMAFRWVSGWLRTLPEFKKSRKLEVVTNWSRSHNRTKAQSVEALEVNYSIAVGTHAFRFKGVPVAVTRSREITGGGFSANEREVLMFRFFAADPKIAHEMVAEAVAFGLKSDDDTIPVYQNQGGYWSFSGQKRKRPASSVFLKAGLWDEIIATIQNFWDTESWYRKANIAYRDSVMLTGPPGTGKSTTFFAVASYFDAPIYYLNLLSEGLNDDNISSLISRLPWGAFVLIEDGDSLFDPNRNVRTDKLGQKQTMVSFSGFLNTLDGLLASEGYVVCLTTNHPERLDDALLRKGRINHRYEIELATVDQITDYLMHLAPPQVERYFIRAWAENTIGNGVIPMSTIQGALIDARGSVLEVIAKFKLPTAEEEERVRKLIEATAPPKEEEKKDDGSPVKGDIATTKSVNGVNPK